MTDVSYPKANTNWTLPQFRVYHRRDTGIVGSPGGSDRQVFADGSGPYIKRLPGARYIQGVYGADDSTWQGTVGANATGQWRVDRVVDQLGTDGVITTVIVPGTPSTTPTPPDLTQTVGGIWQEHLAYFRVKPAFTNITSVDASVVDERRFMPVRVTPVGSEALRPSSPIVGEEVELPDGTRQRWNGSAWVYVGPRLWVGDRPGEVVVGTNATTTATAWSIATPACSALVTLSGNARCLNAGGHVVYLGLVVDGTAYLAAEANIVTAAGTASSFYTAQTVIPFTAATHSVAVRYGVGNGAGAAGWSAVTASIVMGQAL